MKLFSAITPELREWLLKQPVFFIASAPTHGAHVNVSPKGQPSATLAVLSPSRVAYLDRTGSGCETIAHLYENGRATIMFMSFGPSPRILRLFCRGRVVEWDDPHFSDWLARMNQPRPDTVRAIIVLDVFQVSTSCGFGVPRVRRELYGSSVAAAAELQPGSDGGKETATGDFKAELSVFEDRPTMLQYCAKREKAGEVLSYQATNNLDSLDGLPGLRAARRAAGHWLRVEDARAHLVRFRAEWDAVLVGSFLTTVFISVLLLVLLGTGLLGVTVTTGSGSVWDLGQVAAGLGERLQRSAAAIMPFASSAFSPDSR